MTKISDILKSGKKQSVGTGFIKIPDYHDRTDIDDESIEALAKNISEVGLLNPILLEKKGENNYELISGLRRFYAVCKLVLGEIDALVLDNLDDQARMLIMITENAQRQNLNDYDLVVSLVHFLAVTTTKTDDEIKNFLYKLKNHDSGVLKVLSIEDKKLQKTLEDSLDRTDKYKLKTLISKIKVLNFHPDIIKAMQDKKLLFSYAFMLNKIKDEDKMKEILTLFVSEQITKDELKKEVRTALGGSSEKTPIQKITKAMKDFNNFSDAKKKVINDKIYELERLLSEEETA